jgi:hypothetical protein
VTDLGWAIKQFHRERIADYRLYDEYYEGEQKLAFATEKFRNTFGTVFKEFAENACAPVVDSLSDRLEITGFQSSQAQTVTEDIPTGPNIPGAPQASVKKVTVQDEIGTQALEIWRANRMDLQANEVHSESLKEGDAYVIVWPDENGDPQIFPNCAIQCCIEYDSENKTKVLRAAKTWYDEEIGWRINVYLPDKILKFAQRNKADTFPTTERGMRRIETVQNTFGRVPVFHFPNRRLRSYGVSELQGIIPLQDGLNKSVMDMMIAMEFASFKQRYIVGLEVDIDEGTGQPTDPTYRNFGVDRIMAIPDLEAKVGQFDATDLTQFLKVTEKFWASIARVSGTPLHYFFITQGDFPSGEAMKSAEARFVKRILDRQTAFGNVWEDVMLFALRIKGTQQDDLRLETLWKDAAPKSEAELADTSVKKKAVGVSRSQILKEMGYDDETVYRMLEESDAYDSSKMAAESALNQNNQDRQNQGSGTQGVSR